MVVVTMENRSFDHFLGWLAGGDGLPPGRMYPDRKGVSHSSHPLAPDFTGCPHPSPDHSYDQSRVACDDGRMDGFLRAGSNDEYAIVGLLTPSKPPAGTSAPKNRTPWAVLSAWSGMNEWRRQLKFPAVQ